MIKVLNKILFHLEQIYPLKLVLLSLSPILISVFIEYDLVDFRYLLINIIWVPIFSTSAILFRTNFPNKIGAVVLYLIGFIEIAHWLIIKGPITTTSILVMANTNSFEAIEFLSAKSTLSLLVLLPYTLLLILKYKWSKAINQSKFRFSLPILSLLILIVFISENTYHGRFIRKASPQIIKVAFSFVDQIDFYRDAKEVLEIRNVEAEAKNKTVPQCFVLIIGESCNRHHMSFYDGKRLTSPKLDARTDLMIFDNVVSAYSNTISSILSMLSESNLENKKPFKNSIDVFDVFSSAGFKTYWLSNQPPYGVWENQVTSLAQKADVSQFLNISSNSSMEATLTASYDERLLEPFANLLKDENDKKLIILHLMGSHTSYKKRYPKSFDQFTYVNSKEKTIAQYDNSVLYNDYVIDSLLSILTDYSTTHPTHINSAIYLSDHGENVYDEMDKLGHDFAGKLPKSNVDIPFIFWSSEFLSENNLEQLSILDKIDLPFVSDDLFHAIIDVNGIKTPYLNKNKSVFNEQFNSRRRRILVDGEDYDLK